MKRKHWMLTALGGLVLAGVLIAIGYQPAHAVIGGAVLVLLVALLAQSDLGEHVALPRLPYGRRDGARTEISSLSWALNGRTGISLPAQLQLRRVCLVALHERDIDPHTSAGREQAERLLTQGVAAFVLDLDAPPPDIRTIRHTLDTLENLEKT